MKKTSILQLPNYCDGKRHLHWLSQQRAQKLFSSCIIQLDQEAALVFFLSLVASLRVVSVWLLTASLAMS